MRSHKFASATFGALVFCLATKSFPTFAWGGDGHRIVCAIAWEEMKPGARDGARRLLGIEDREGFADICTWADDFRTHGHRETAGWHFLNVPPNATKVDVRRDCSSRRSCVVAQIAKDEDVLRSDAADVEKATALKFLAHFVGDVHQPLHVGRAEDKGGNAIKGRFMGRNADLHQVWDSLIIRNSHIKWPEIAERLERRITKGQRTEWIKSTPEEWANESLAVSRDPATEYVDRGQPFTLGEGYEHQELTVVYDRVSRAGLRLGHILNEALR